MYEKVSTNLNFVDRETITFLKKALIPEKKGRNSFSMTDRRRPTANRISAMC